MTEAIETVTTGAEIGARPTFPAYQALQDAIQRALKSRTDAEYAEAWAEALRLKDAGLADERRMRAYLDRLPYETERSA